LNVGDTVIIPDAAGYDGFSWGKIEKFTPKRVLVRPSDDYWGTKLKDPRSVLLMGDEQLKALTIQVLRS
jgi:hypothetical protein